MQRNHTEKIANEKWYNLVQIVKLGLFPWCKDIKTIRNWIHRDLLGKNTLKAMVSGHGIQARYKVLGKNLAEFVKQVETGTYLN